MTTPSSTTVNVSRPVRAELDRIAGQLRAEKGRGVSVSEAIEWLIESRAALADQTAKALELNAGLIRYSEHLEQQLAARDA